MSLQELVERKKEEYHQQQPIKAEKYNNKFKKVINDYNIGYIFKLAINQLQLDVDYPYSYPAGQKQEVREWYPEIDEIIDFKADEFKNIAKRYKWLAAANREDSKAVVEAFDTFKKDIELEKIKEKPAKYLTWGKLEDN